MCFVVRVNEAPIGADVLPIVLNDVKHLLLLFVQLNDLVGLEDQINSQNRRHHASHDDIASDIPAHIAEVALDLVGHVLVADCHSDVVKTVDVAWGLVEHGVVVLHEGLAEDPVFDLRVFEDGEVASLLATESVVKYHFRKDGGVELSVISVV